MHSDDNFPRDIDGGSQKDPFESIDTSEDDELEFDLTQQGSGSKTQIMGSGDDELEFDPTTIAPPAPDFPVILTPQPPHGALLNEHSPLPNEHSPLLNQTGQSAPIVGELDLTAEILEDPSAASDSDEFQLLPSQRAGPLESSSDHREKTHRSPSLVPHSSGHPPVSIRHSQAPVQVQVATGASMEIPALEVVRAPAARVPRRQESARPGKKDRGAGRAAPSKKGSQRSAPPASGLSLDLGHSGPSSHPEPSRPSSARISASVSPASVASQASARPLGSISLSSAPPRASHPPAHLATLGGGVSIDALDDLEFGGAQAAQLDVAIPTATTEDDLPWPVGRNPFDEEISVDEIEALRLSGYGPAPGNLLLTPLYAFRVLSGQRALKDKLKSALLQLKKSEISRDDLLAKMAEFKRRDLQENDRFRNMYSAADQANARVVAAERALQGADVEGAAELSALKARLDTAERTERERLAARDEDKAQVAAVERDIQRAQAAIRRLDIEERNLEDRQERSVAPTDDFSARFADIDAERAHIGSSIEAMQLDLAKANAALRQAEDVLRKASNDRIELDSKREGLILALEGELFAHSRAYDEAVGSRRELLSDIGRAIVQLKGAVPVDKKLRERLLKADKAVSAHATLVATLKRAEVAMDEDAFSNGKTVSLLLAALVVAFFVWALTL